MPAKITIERLLRDADDDSGQTIRDWKIESEPGHITIRLKHGDGFLLLRASDIDTFYADILLAKKAADSLASERS